MRDSMIIYRSFYEAIRELPKEAQADVWGAIFEYGLNFKTTEHQGIAGTIFKLIKPQLDANNHRYKTGVKYGKMGADFGKLGGRPKGGSEGVIKKPQKNPHPNPQKTLNKPSNVNVNENENVNENVNEVIHPFDSVEWTKAWDGWIDYRVEAKKPYKTFRAVQTQLKWFNQYTQQESIAIIEQSIKNQWQGLFPLKQTDNGKKEHNVSTVNKLFGAFNELKSKDST